MWDSFFNFLGDAKERLRVPTQKAPQTRLRLFNTLTNQVEPFVPLGGTIKMYNCGPTVYAAPHIGNLRGPLLANLVRRTLLNWGYYVKHVSNITDVGHLTGDNLGDADTGVDRIEASASARGLTAQDIAHEYTELFYHDLDALGIDRSKIVFAPATEYIAEQIALVKTLEEKGYTYATSDGIYFNTAKFPEYGKLGHIHLEGQQEGARVEENREKKNPSDFALWKFSPKSESGAPKRQQEWPSPWGVGFPGWHLECTAIVFTLLGKQIDLHIGGIDLIPTHHNNEIAQAEAATGKQFVLNWMHNAFITIEGKRISKSLGNTVYLHNLIDKGLNPQSLRYWYLTAHYRTPMNFTWDSIAGADQALSRLSRTYTELSIAAHHASPDPSFMNDFYNALADDLDTPRMLARLWELVKDQEINPDVKRASLVEADKVLGLGITTPRQAAKLRVVEESALPPQVQQLLTDRELARTQKNFQKADELRIAIEQAGFDIKDTPEGPELTAKK